MSEEITGSSLGRPSEDRHLLHKPGDRVWSSDMCKGRRKADPTKLSSTISCGTRTPHCPFRRWGWLLANHKQSWLFSRVKERDIIHGLPLRFPKGHKFRTHSVHYHPADLKHRQVGLLTVIAFPHDGTDFL